jgi:hypothetical protein
MASMVYRWAQISLWQVSELGGPFPLTPALSLGERENRCPPVGESERVGMGENQAWLN